uniref:EGF-like domain-containing protein n=1 Tax=Parastrongyloides trichosuri TaxID=131310 RepID=A0A0N4Z757_PARTI
MDKVAFVNPQSKCRIRCLNGGVCAYKIKAPREHVCICMEGMFEGIYCEKRVSSTISTESQSTSTTSVTTPSTTTIFYKQEYPDRESKMLYEDESMESNEWDSNTIVSDDTNNEGNRVIEIEEQQSNDNHNINGYGEEARKVNDDTSMGYNNEDKQIEKNNNDEEEDDEDNDGNEEGNVPYFDQPEDSSSTEVYDTQEIYKESKFRSIPTLETSTVSDTTTNRIHIKPKSYIIKTTPGPVNYYLQGGEGFKDDDGWMMVKKRNYAIRITNVASPIKNVLINYTLISTLLSIIITKFIL